jgi:hypothetical protein
MIIFASQKNYAIGFGEVPLHQINSFLDQTFSKRFDVSINLLSKERSFTKKGLFLLRKNW